MRLLDPSAERLQEFLCVPGDGVPRREVFAADRKRALPVRPGGLRPFRSPSSSPRKLTVRLNSTCSRLRFHLRNHQIGSLPIQRDDPDADIGTNECFRPRSAMGTKRGQVSDESVREVDHPSPIIHCETPSGCERGAAGLSDSAIPLHQLETAQASTRLRPGR